MQSSPIGAMVFAMLRRLGIHSIYVLTSFPLASGVWIEVGRIGSTARATIIDDGVGGAHPSKGHGLSGLMERVRGADGILDIQSPDGGPTSIIVEVPCG